MIKSEKELYNYILDNYGHRLAWLSDLSRALNITRKEANHLTYVLGYRRGKLIPSLKASFQDFATDEQVISILEKINAA